MSGEPTAPAAATPPPEPSTVSSPASVGTSGDMAAKLEERPELALGGAFAGGLLAALILKRLAR